MCNDYRLHVGAIVEEFAELQVKSRFGEGKPNNEARDDIKITDVGPIVRSVDGARDEGNLVQRRWSWPGPNKRPVYNFRFDERDFASHRCLILADGFYEFTAPNATGKKRKEKWLLPGPTGGWSASPGSGAIRWK